MQKYKNLTIIGTSHISIESIKEVKAAISSLKPEIIALELDRPRFLALTTNKKHYVSVKKLGAKAYLINQLGAWIEKKLGNLVGISPGQEMKEAISLAKKNKIKIALIDRDIRKTLNKIANNLSGREKSRFIFDLIKSFFIKSGEKIDLRKVPPEKLIQTLLKEFKKRYPALYKILIEERNEIMAKNLYTLINTNTNEKIIAILGAGHETEIIKQIKKWDSQKKSGKVY